VNNVREGAKLDMESGKYGITGGKLFNDEAKSKMVEYAWTSERWETGNMTIPVVKGDATS
jgi:hypothetical protein